MLIKSLAGLIAAAALAGCVTPCDAPGRLCAPGQPNTSVPQRARAPQVDLHTPAPPPPEARAMPEGTSPTVRIALLLPLHSATLGQAAEAVRAGFMAGWERDRSGIEVDLVATGDSAQDAIDAYSRASEQDDIVVGPLARSAVNALAAGAEVRKPTIALNHPGNGNTLPGPMLAIGLSVEDEARQVAQWASNEHPNGRALVLAGPAAWEKRIAKAFRARWSELGHTLQRVELPAADGQVGPDAIAELKARVEIDPPDVLFAALDAGELRQVRAALGTAIPCYGTSSVNPGRGPGAAVVELDGLRLLDLPWEVQADHPAVMVYPRPVVEGGSMDMDRLYALGIDAFRVAREIALHSEGGFRLEGVTGQLAVGTGVFERTEAQVVYQGGAFQPVER